MMSDRWRTFADQKITVWTAEIAIPLDVLNARPSSAVGLDVLWHDANRHDADRGREEAVTGTWRWAGRSTSLGSLFFGRRHRVALMVEPGATRRAADAS